jgi:hypothetical protein
MTEKELTVETVLNKIKSRGHWKVIIRPTQFKKNRLSLQECNQFIRECKVMLRGWDYPHISSRSPPYVGGEDYMEALTDWDGHIELWRMYQSGQFLHLFGCLEDWLAEEIPIFGRSRYSDISPGSVLEVMNTLYRFTEIYEFASRLAQKKLFEETLFLSVTLYGMENRKLIFFDVRRHLGDYVCRVKNLSQEKTITVNELLGKAHELALDHTIWVLEHFNWLSPPREILKEDQKKFLEGRI